MTDYKVIISGTDWHDIEKRTRDAGQYGVETGGDLFGQINHETKEIFVRFGLPEGPEITRTTAEWHQDKEWLANIGAQLATQGHKHVGIWHSHHALNVPHPSRGNDMTIHRVLSDRAAGTSPEVFLALITTTPTAARVDIQAFLYQLHPVTRQFQRVPISRRNICVVDYEMAGRHQAAVTVLEEIERLLAVQSTRRLTRLSVPAGILVEIAKPDLARHLGIPGTPLH